MQTIYVVVKLVPLVRIPGFLQFNYIITYVHVYDRGINIDFPSLPISSLNQTPAIQTTCIWFWKSCLARKLLYVRITCSYVAMCVCSNKYIYHYPKEAYKQMLL